jgi:hypothetical protein
MRAQFTTTVYIITLVFTLTCTVLGQTLPGEVGNRMLGLGMFGMMGCVISFFTALVAAFKADVPKEIM